MIVWASLTAEQRLAYVKPLWVAGKSAREISATLDGATRNAVIGVVARNGLNRNDGGVTARLAGRASKNRIAKADRPAPNTGGARKVVAIRAQAKSRPLPELPPMLDATHAKPWFDRAFGQCAYPISGEGADTFSCCAPTLGHTYCRAHREVMFATPAPRQAVSPRPMARRFAA